MPNTVSCRDGGKLCREFGGRFTGKKKRHRTQCLRALPGRAEFRLPGRPHLPRVSRPPSPNHQERVVGKRYSRGYREFQAQPGWWKSEGTNRCSGREQWGGEIEEDENRAVLQIVNVGEAIRAQRRGEIGERK